MLNLAGVSNANGCFLIYSQREASVQYVFVADDNFTLSTIYMTFYAHKNLPVRYIMLNYLLSRARRTTENTFEVLSNLFKIFCSKIYLNPVTVTKVVMASCFLHNFLRTLSAASYTLASYKDRILEDWAVIERQWKNKDSSPYIYAFQPTRSRHATIAAEYVTNILREYFVGKQGMTGSNRNTLM